METPGSGGGATVSGSPGRAEQGVAAACQAGCSGIGGQVVPGGGMQQGFLNSDPWANWLGQRQAQEFYNQQLLLQQQFRNAQSVPVPPSVSSTPGNQGPVNQGQGFGMSYGVVQSETVTQVTRLLKQLNQAELQAVFQSVGQPSQGFVPRHLGGLYESPGNLPGWGVEKSTKDVGGNEKRTQQQTTTRTGSPGRTKRWAGVPTSKSCRAGRHKAQSNSEEKSSSRVGG